MGLFKLKQTGSSSSRRCGSSAARLIAVGLLEPVRLRRAWSAPVLSASGRITLTPAILGEVSPSTRPVVVDTWVSPTAIARDEIGQIMMSNPHMLGFLDTSTRLVCYQQPRTSRQYRMCRSARGLRPS